MTLILSALNNQLLSLSFTHPETFVDLYLALFLLVGFLIYIRNFPSFRVILGMLILIFCSVIFFKIGFIFTSVVFILASTLVLVSLPLIFSSEIRHYLEKIGRFSFLRVNMTTKKRKTKELVETLVSDAFSLASKKIGASLVIERRTGLGETLSTGIPINAKLDSRLLESIFFPKNPLHDGAVVIKGDRVIAANCLLPISGEAKLDPPFGTRHSASLAITKDTDAVVLIVSEQRGMVSLAENGRLHPDLSREELMDSLTKLL